MAVLMLLGLALGRAALFRFQEKERAIRAVCQEQLKKLGITREVAKAKYPTPEIKMVSAGCLLPGSTADVVVSGKFVPDTKFVFENDNVEVVKENLTATEYRATLKAAPGIGPQTADLQAISPVTAITTRSDRAATVGGKYEWTLDSGNGWKIVARSPADKACPTKPSAQDTYEMAFYRKGEANPFEKRTATLYFSVHDSTNYHFVISQEDPKTKAGMDDFATLMKKMGDPNLTGQQRDQLMKQMEKAQQQMQSEIAKMTDPSYAQKVQAQRQQFGCERVEIAAQAGVFKGQMRCADSVGARIALTGSVKLLGR